MAEETEGVGGSKAGDPETLEREIEDVRDDMGRIVGELDRRRHDRFDWRVQVRSHARAVGIVALSLVVAMGGAIGFSIWRARRRARPMAKARRLREALSRIVEHPEWVARPHPSVGKKALGAAASAFAGTLSKAAAQRLADRVGRTPKPERLG
jgi:hypothetical protein